MFERYAPAITSFCRHMLGSAEEAEEAVQHTFAAAYRSLLRDDRDMALKPWLYKIARNHCISILRERLDQVSATPDAVTGGLAEHVERRADLRALLRDLSELPHEQREALLLTEVSGLSHQEVGRILGCPTQRVKGLVFRARRNLMEWRDARETPCDQIREQLVTLRGTELRRNELRHHLRVCPGCREFLAEIRHQRTLLQLALPVAPSAGLKASVLGAAGLGGGSAAGGLTAIGAKVAVVAVAVGGGAAITETAVRDEEHPSRTTPTTVGTVGEAASRPDVGASGDRRPEAPEQPRSSDFSDASGADEQAPSPRAEGDPDGPDRGELDESTADDGAGRERDPGPGDGPERDQGGGLKPKKGKPPSQANNRGPAPPPKRGSPPGSPPKGGGPGQGAPPGSGAPPPGSNPPPGGNPPPSSNAPPSGNPPASDKQGPRLQLPDLNPGDDQDGLSLELPVPRSTR